MATRSHIAYQDKETNKIHMVYCHWDGYLDYNGKVLLRHYNEYDKIVKLISKGDFSSLYEDIERVDYYDEHEDTKPTIYDKEQDMAKEEYNYLFKNNKWYYCTWNEKEFKPLQSEDVR